MRDTLRDAQPAHTCPAAPETSGKPPRLRQVFEQAVAKDDGFALGHLALANKGAVG